jgi:NAD(P)-dependent dehydrogenase (short-subunit alcohol dehydrogenase family)
VRDDEAMVERASRRFADRIAIVTGAAGGIGAATAERLGMEGAAVILVDRDTERVDRVAADLAARGVSTEPAAADVADEGAWQQVVRMAQDAFGGVDVLVNNACAWDLVAAHRLEPDAWRRQLDACLTSTFLGFRACHAQLDARGGNVVNVSSVHALIGIPGHPAYAAAKGGVVALTRQLAVEYGPRIRANTVLPGPILTAAWDRISAEDRDRGVAGTVAKRFGAPEEVAAAIAFLASDDASYITGTTLTVDGGWSACK